MISNGNAAKALQSLVNDLVENILLNADNPGACAEYLTSQIRELIGVRMVALISFEEGAGAKLESVCPRRMEAEWRKPEIQEFISAMVPHKTARLINPSTDPEGRSFLQLGMGISFVVPLQVGEETVGMLLLLDLMETKGADHILESLVKVSRILALILKNSLLFKTLEKRVEERTAELHAANNKLQVQYEELQVNEEELRSQNDELLSSEVMLRTSEERHRSILQTAMDGIWLFDAQGRFVEINETYCRMSGYSMQELLTMSIPDVEFLETASDTAARIRSIMERGEDRFESRHRRKDGSIYDVEVSVQYRPTDGGQFVAFVQDISGRKLTEKVLKRAQFTVQHASDALFWITPDARIVDVNEAACIYLDYSRDELLRLAVQDIDVLHNAEIWPGHFAELRRCGSLKFESIQRTRDGRQFPVEIVANYMVLGDEELICAFVRNITERKLAEDKLLSLSQRLQLATSSAHLGIWDWNVRDNKMVWDDRMFELYGSTREAFPNSIDAWLNGLHPDDKEAAMAENQAALVGEKEFDTDFRVLHPDGTVKYIKGNGLVIRGTDGAAERMIGINYDVTDAKNTAEQKSTLESQLHQAQKMESVGRLAGGVAHDFNNMLTVILGHAELGLMRLDPNHPVCVDLKEISSTAERSADLTRQLLAFARKQTVAPKVLDLNETVTYMLKMLQRLIGEDINLSWQPAPELWQIRMDPSQIDQILANLCVNARDAIAGVGRITIETANSSIDVEYCSANLEAVPGEYVCLSVSDSGSGMDRETQTHIFEPFYTTKEQGKGTGLGLATVYGAVKQNNGFINIYSEPGQGTTFSIYLPRDANMDTARRAPTDEETAVPRGQETILLVEDEPAILNIASVMLEKQGYTVLKANTPGEALRVAREHVGQIDLLMTDVIMPEMNGRDLAKNLLSIHPHMKRLFMSGYTADVIAHHGVLDDGVHFIQKPFSLPNMAAMVREVLDKS